jgi:hypothetical protein
MKIKSLFFAAVLCTFMAFFVQAEDKKAAPKPYPLDKCIVTDEKLGDHGKPYVFVHEGQEIKMCCKDCLGDFKKDTAKYLKKLEAPKAKK